MWIPNNMGYWGDPWVWFHGKKSKIVLVKKGWVFLEFHFFLESFNLWRPLLMITLYHQTKTPISFWCRRELNSRSFIQSSETLLVELIETHFRLWVIFSIVKNEKIYKTFLQNRDYFTTF